MRERERERCERERCERERERERGGCEREGERAGCARESEREREGERERGVRERGRESGVARARARERERERERGEKGDRCHSLTLGISSHGIKKFCITFSATVVSSATRRPRCCHGDWLKRGLPQARGQRLSRRGRGRWRGRGKKTLKFKRKSHYQNI